MKKIGVLAVVASLALSLAVFAGETSGTGKTKKNGQTQSAQDQSGAKKGRPDAAKELETLKAEHKAAMDELLAIKKLATEEKATKTVAALDKLMALREQQFQKKIAPLQKGEKSKGGKRQGKGGKKSGGNNPQ